MTNISHFIKYQFKQMFLFFLASSLFTIDVLVDLQLHYLTTLQSTSS